MNILKAVLQNEVFPALGCTEPIAVAYAASLAARELGEPPDTIRITVDPGVYKNGLAVTVPNTGGERGNLMAGVLGALIKQPELKMEILQGVTTDMIPRARALIQAQQATIRCDDAKKTLYIEVIAATPRHSARAVIEQSHTNLTRLEKDRQPIFRKAAAAAARGAQTYKARLKQMRIADLIDCAEGLDASDARYLQRGLAMNLRVAAAGQTLRKVGYYLANLLQKGYLVDDVVSSTKILAASASDARMAGLNFPVMSSGGSGNQGIVAILVPYQVGQYFHIPEPKILQSIALSHLINSYIKCFTGDLSPLCGCAIAAGVGAAAAIVYQQSGKNMPRITLAVNNLISDLGGMLCDGAKGGCALKIVSSTDAAIRSAYMALNDYGITEIEGFVGKTAEETIDNLSRISAIGMANVDATMLSIMKAKNAQT